MGNGYSWESNESAPWSDSADGLLWKLIKKALGKGEDLWGRRETIRLPLLEGKEYIKEGRVCEA